MSCREAGHAISAERDGVLSEAQRAALAAHLASCAPCRELSRRLAAATESWRRAAAAAVPPDVEGEWRDIRARLHEREGAGDRPTALRRVTWIGGPLAAAALLALAAVMYFRPPAPPVAAEIARAEFVEIPDASASPVVYVDEESGWLVVWTVTDSVRAGS